jgi:hypothetical protein
VEEPYKKLEWFSSEESKDVLPERDLGGEHLNCGGEKSLVKGIITSDKRLGW